MQVTVKDIKVKEGTTKSGPNTGKPWKLIILVGQDGTEFTTFDAGAQEVGVGGVIELEPIIKAGKINFTEFKIIQKGSLPAPSDNGKGMTPELWAEKDRLERWSRECNTCFMGIMELAKIKPPHDNFKLVYDAALDWALDHFQTKEPVAKPAQKPPMERTESTTEPLTDLKDMVFADAGKLKTYLKDDLGMDGMQIAAATAGFVLTTEEGRKECWVSILETREEKSNEEDIPF